MILLPLAFLAAGAMRTLYTAPVEDISQAKRLNGGYLVREVVYDSRVIFPASDWKMMDRGHLLHPATGAAFRFAGRSFGRQFKSFFIWGYVSREHQWARALDEISDQDEKHARFLTEWLDRALRKREIDVFNRLGLAYTMLDRSEEQAMFFPLELSPASQTINVRHETIGSHRFAITSLSTRTENVDKPLMLDTEIYICGFHHHARMDDWLFFAAYSHIPTHLPQAQKETLRRLFLQTLATLTLTPRKD